MTARRKKKYRKYLGKRYARRGYNDRNRGAGNRGGRGMSGWRFKKQKRIAFMKYHKELLEDKKGFTSPKLNRPIIAINVGELEEYFDYLLDKGLIVKEDDYYVINLDNLGIDKLLGKGDINKKMKIMVKKASSKAIEKIKAKGGEVIITS